MQKEFSDFTRSLNSKNFFEFSLEIKDSINRENFSSTEKIRKYIIFQLHFVKLRGDALIKNDLSSADFYLRMIIWIDSMIHQLKEQQAEKYFKEQLRLKKNSTRQENKKNFSPQLSVYWQGTNISYQNCINFLKRFNHCIDDHFADFDSNDNLIWNQSPFKWRQYLVGFLYTCVNKKLISKVEKTPFTSTELLTIIQGTFNVKLDRKPLKSLHKNPPSSEYLEPFKNLNKYLTK
jgi:hypothetical protein